MTGKGVQSGPSLVLEIEKNKDEIALENQKKLESLFPITNEFTKANREKAIYTLSGSTSKVSKIVGLTLAQEEEIKIGSLGDLEKLRKKGYTDKQILLVLALQEGTEFAKYTEYARNLIRTNTISQLSETDFLELVDTPGGMVILDDILFEKKHIDSKIRFFMPLSIRALQKLFETGNDRFVRSHFDSFQIDDTIKAVLQKCKHEKKFRATMDASFAKFQKQLAPIDPQLIPQFHETVQENIFQKNMDKIQENVSYLIRTHSLERKTNLQVLFNGSVLSVFILGLIGYLVGSALRFDVGFIELCGMIAPYITGLIALIILIAEDGSLVTEKHGDALLQRRSFKQGELGLSVNQLQVIKKTLLKGTPGYKEVKMMIDIYEKKGLGTKEKEDEKQLFSDIFHVGKSKIKQMKRDHIITTAEKLLHSVEQSISPDDQRKIFQWIESTVGIKYDMSALVSKKICIISNNLPNLQGVTTGKQLDDIFLPRINEFLTTYSLNESYSYNTDAIEVIKDTFLIDNYTDNNSIKAFANEYNRVFEKILSNISSIDEFVTLFQINNHNGTPFTRWIDLYKTSQDFLSNNNIEYLKGIMSKKIIELCIQDKNANTSTKEKLIQIQKDVNLFPDRE